MGPMSYWFRMCHTFARHRKIRLLAKILDIKVAHARGLVTGLLCAVCDAAPDGDITDWSQDDVAYWCDWDGDPAVLYDALFSLRWIVRTEQLTDEINDWMEYAEGWRRAERERERRKNKRLERAKKTVPHACPTRAPESVTRVGDQTGPDQTRPDQQTKVPNQTNEPTDQQLPAATDAKASALSVRSDLVGTQPNPKAARDDIQEIWQHYRIHHPKTTKVLRSDRKEYRLIRAALQDFAIADVKSAIDGYHRSPFHCGQNDRNKRYLSLDLILRDISHIQTGLEMLQPGSNGGPQGKRMLDRTLLTGDRNG